MEVPTHPLTDDSIMLADGHIIHHHHHLLPLGPRVVIPIHSPFLPLTPHPCQIYLHLQLASITTA